MGKVKVDWDTESDGEILTLKEVGLSEVMEVPDDVIAEHENGDDEAIANWLSDNWGFCVNSVMIL